MDFLPWHDPLDTVIGFVARQGYYKPYALWREGAWVYEAEATQTALPLNQAIYLIRHVPVVWSVPPYTRVRFDQCSRKTQLLSVQHGQYTRRRGGLSFLYRRRTRIGEYLGQTTDHYNVGLSLYAPIKRWWLFADGGWNQLQDGVNGGVLYETSPQEAFLKERQLVRMNGARLRRWYRFVEGEVGFQLSSCHRLFLRGRLSEDRIEVTTEPALRSESTLYPDTISFSTDSRQWISTAEMGIISPLWTGRLRYLYDHGQLRSITRGKWAAAAIEGDFSAQVRNFSLQARYRQWIGPSTPAPSFFVEGRKQLKTYEIGASHERRNLPWFAYLSTPSAMAQNEAVWRAWVEKAFTSSDTTIPPITLRSWLTRWTNAWLADSTFQSRRPLWAVGLTLRGGWRKKALGFVAGLSVQRVWEAEASWRHALPVVSGWIQPFVRWQIRQTPPVYHLGVRLSGFTRFQPMAYALPMTTFYIEPNYTALFQPPYIWADPYFVILIRRVMVYLRIEHLSEGLLGHGYYLAAWYPMPGRGFSFGVQWDIYN